jgi:prevent-host-death family protein
MVMKRISIQDLKAQLSAAISDAESGNTIVITRHNEAVAKLIPAYPQNVHRVKEGGTAGLKPALKRRTKIPYLNILSEDRGNH